MDRDPAPAAARAEFDAWREEIWRDRLDGDPFFTGLLRRHLGPGYAGIEPHLRRLADATGRGFDAEVLACSRDEHLPRLHGHDAEGRPLERVLFHPAYHEVGRAFWSSGVLAVLAQPASNVASGARAYLLDQHGEAGHACPVACTAGAIKLIQRLGNEEQRRRYLPALLQADYNRRLHAAQFVTEVQGGSDVGRNACRAVAEAPGSGRFRLHGEKWFCSVADAGLFVVSARVEGGAAGTRGLGLFLVPREIDGRPNGFRLRRLKYKLGTRSMATGEIDFDGARAEAIGPVEHGFKNLVEIVLDTSRVHNALGACGLMRRASVEAHAFARHRSAFERKILDFPAVAELLARMKRNTMAGLATTFRLLALSDRLERADDPELAGSRRIAVMLNKYRTSTAGTCTARDGIEVLGGNGTIEEFSALPRLYRDAIVYESWEGTHNTLCAQILRDFGTQGLHRPWLWQLERELADVTAEELWPRRDAAQALHGEVTRRIERLLGADPFRASAALRHVVDDMGRLTEEAALLAQADWELAQGTASPAAELLELERLLRTDPLETPERAEAIRRFTATP